MEVHESSLKFATIPGRQRQNRTEQVAVELTLKRMWSFVGNAYFNLSEFIPHFGENISNEFFSYKRIFIYSAPTDLWRLRDGFSERKDG